jgi:protein-S-isoprenylcysteine O-methyltransferase Ste14
VRIPEWVFHRRGILAALPVVAALFMTTGQYDNDLVTWPLAAVLVLAGMLVRVWAQQHLQHRLRASMDLTVTGPYQYVRNPLYLGNTLLCVGASVAAKLLWLAPLILLWCAVVYSLVVRFEEGHLMTKYGAAYLQYMRDVPRWWPRRAIFRRPGFVRQYLAHSVLAELHCPLILLPFVLKEAFLAGWFWR